MNYAPLALFVYNRPWHTRQAVESLLANPLVAQTDLYIFSDAAKHEGASSSVEEVREYIRGISGFKSVTLVERETNWGLARSIIDGVTRLCEQFGRVIVLEDDLVVAPGFLAYMNHGLERYAEDDRVMQVAGYMFPVRLDLPCDALFMTFISSWGWATWARAWKHFDPDAKEYQRLAKNRSMRDRFDLNGGYRYFKMLQAQQSGRSESWAIRWYLSVFMRNGLTLYPAKTLVSNHGFDGSGVNCAVSTIHETEIDPAFQVVWLPEEVAPSRMQETVVRNLPRPRFSLASLKRKLQEWGRQLLAGSTLRMK